MLLVSSSFYDVVCFNQVFVFQFCDVDEVRTIHKIYDLARFGYILDIEKSRKNPESFYILGYIYYNLSLKSRDLEKHSLKSVTCGPFFP